jgi:hypothetical protein
MTKIGLYDIANSTTPESNKSLRVKIGDVIKLSVGCNQFTTPTER